MKEKALEDFQYETKGLEETNTRHKERVSAGCDKVCKFILPNRAS